MNTNHVRAGLAGLICLTLASAAMSQPTPPGSGQSTPIPKGPGKRVETPLDASVQGAVIRMPEQLVACHATFFRAGTGTSHTPPSWTIGVVVGSTDNEKMAACKASVTDKWLANGEILKHLNYTTADQDKICKSGKVEVRIDFGWQDPNTSRKVQPSFTYLVSAPHCSCTCSKSSDMFVDAEKKCATKIATTSGINNGNLGGGWYGIAGSLYQLNSSPYSCKFHIG